LQLDLPHAGKEHEFCNARPIAKKKIFNVYDGAHWRSMENICRTWTGWKEPTKSMITMPQLTGCLSLVALTIYQHLQARPMKKAMSNLYFFAM
jgi:hypothetical protein